MENRNYDTIKEHAENRRKQKNIWRTETTIR